MFSNFINKYKKIIDLCLKILYSIWTLMRSGCAHERTKSEGGIRPRGGGTVEGDRCPRLVQCRDGRSRGKVRCCVSCVSVSYLSVNFSVTRYRVFRACVVLLLLVPYWRGLRVYILVAAAAAAEVRVSPER